MKPTHHDLRAREDAIFDALEDAPGNAALLNRLYRDGVPTPEAYVVQRVRILFVFREPNLGGEAYAHDMRDEVRDPRFRPLERDGTRRKVSEKGWWNWKAGMFAHAAAAALADEASAEAFDRFESGGWHHEVVNRFAYIQVKKVGGGGSAKADEICEHAAKYATTLKQQVDLYLPHLVLGCGLGRDSPAQLLATHVLVGAREEIPVQTGRTWWKYSTTARPTAMIELQHPASRGRKSALYEEVWGSVREVAHTMGLAHSRTSQSSA